MHDESADAIRNYFRWPMMNFSLKSIIDKWQRMIDDSKRQIDSGTINNWIVKWMRSAKHDEKMIWEAFIAKCVMKKLQRVRTTTQKQSCQMTWEHIKPTEKVQKVVVWNGNGIRARTSGSNELTRLVQATNPDILCFLESKVNADRLMKIPNFEQWVEDAGFRNLYCHWSHKECDSSYGTEGIILFSKADCINVTYGMDNPSFDDQARILTAEYDDHIHIFSYNPQGGFVPQSLTYRTEWERAFTTYLKDES